MFEEEEKNEKKTENNLENSTTIQKNNDAEKKEQNNDGNLNNKNNEEKNINNHNTHLSKKINSDDIKRISNSFYIISNPAKEGEKLGTCFFMCIKDKKYLITDKDVIPKKLIRAKKEIEIINNFGEKFCIELERRQRIIKYIQQPFDFLVIEILEEDKINNVQYLDYDYDDYIKKYYKKEIFILHCPEGEEIHISSGIITNIDEKKYEFEYNSNYDSSDFSIFLNENAKIIGIFYKKKVKKVKIKKGIFIFRLIEVICKSNISQCLIDLNKINNDNEINDNNEKEFEENNILILKYNVNEDPIVLFSEHFFKNTFNRNNLIMSINGAEYKPIKKQLNYKDIKTSTNQIEIKIKFIEPTANISEMFYKCISLTSVKFINFVTSRLNNMKCLFADCGNLAEIYGIEAFDTSRIKDISNLFSGCKSLITLPKTLDWDTSKIEKMNEVFSGCESLKEIPDISKWKTNKVKYMKGLFKKCKSLKTIPDIKNWDTSNVINMSFMFHNCEQLEMLPDISFWNTSQVLTLCNTFSNCKSLQSFPDISKWKTVNLEAMNNIFLSCNVSILPDISKWKTKKDNNCINEEALPAANKVNNKKVKTKKVNKDKK